MKIFQVILATLVIFGSGALTGALIMNRIHGPAPDAVPPPYRPVVIRSNMPTAQPVALRTNTPAWPRGADEVAQRRVQYLERIAPQLELTEAQKTEIAEILKESHQRIRALSESIGPDVRKEIKETHERFQKCLNNEQRVKFRELNRARNQRNANNPERKGANAEGRRPGNAKQATNEVERLNLSPPALRANPEQ